MNCLTQLTSTIQCTGFVGITPDTKVKMANATKYSSLKGSYFVSFIMRKLKGMIQHNQCTVTLP